MPIKSPSQLKAVELFAGVGGFHEGLKKAGGFEVVWSNQWEPSSRSQFASNCYQAHFPETPHVNEDIEKVLNHSLEGDPLPNELFDHCPELPKHDLLVGGFPCQDYSVAKPLNQAHGIKGKKGVLWWQIYRILEWRKPRFVLLENVDRLLKSPGSQRGRDFAIILSCFRFLGYDVEWRVINAAEYGFPQRRRRVFLLAQRRNKTDALQSEVSRVFVNGVLARAFPVAGPGKLFASDALREIRLPEKENEISLKFGLGNEKSDFRNAGVMINGIVYTGDVTPDSDRWCASGPKTLGDVVANTHEEDVPAEFYIPKERLDDWKYLKGAKSEERIKKSGFKYFYTEGALPFPDPLDRPSRTILTGEGGLSPSRFKHVIQDGRRYRRLIPEELEELNGFERGWTAETKTTKMSDIKRAFCMGNALVVGVVERIATEIANEVKPTPVGTLASTR